MAGNKSCPCARQDVKAIRCIPNISINRRFWFVLCNHYQLLITHFSHWWMHYMYTINNHYRYCCSFYTKKSDNRTLRCHNALNSYLLFLKLQTNTTITTSFLCDKNLLVWRHKARQRKFNRAGGQYEYTKILVPPTQPPNKTDRF